MIQGSFRIYKRSSKGGSRELQGGLKDILRKFQRCLKKVLSVFQEYFKNKFQGCFKHVSMKFCFVLQLPGQKDGLLPSSVPVQFQLSPI